MALNPRTDVVTRSYTRQLTEKMDEEYYADQLREIEAAIASIYDAVPQAADAPPRNPRRGLLRYAVAPWDPGEGSGKWYGHDGEEWSLHGSGSAGGAYATSSDPATDIWYTGTIYKDGVSLLKEDGTAENLFIGRNTAAGLTTGAGNVALGKSALYALTTGTNNMAIGKSAAGALTTGKDNMAIGSAALRLCQTGDGNVALGTLALYALLTGDENVGIGYFALRNTAAGNRNTAVGDWALWHTDGSERVAIGYNAASEAPGARTVSVGYKAAQNFSTGSGFVVLGGLVNSPVADPTNHVFIADGQGNLRVTIDADGSIEAHGPVKFASKTVSELTGAFAASNAGAGATLYITDEVGGPVLATSDGTNWRRAYDNAIVT